MRRVDWVLAGLFLLSLPLEGFLLWGLGGDAFYRWGVDLTLELGLVRLVFCLPGLSAFCLQLLLCRRGRRWTAQLPSALAVVALGCCLMGLAMARGWDGLGWGFGCVLVGALLIGCALAWAVYGLCRLKDWCS